MKLLSFSRSDFKLIDGFDPKNKNKQIKGNKKPQGSHSLFSCFFLNFTSFGFNAIWSLLSDLYSDQLTATFFSHTNGIDGEVIYSREFISSVRNLLINKTFAQL